MPTQLVLLVALAALCLVSTAAEVGPPPPLDPVPSVDQLAWQRGELTMFVHFTVNTFTDREWGEGTEDPSVFNPTHLDARQWAKTAKAGGFRIVILTAKHHDGFCLWPSRYTNHSVKNSPWRGGKGDVVREFVDACHAEGLKVGIYLSPWDRHEPSYGDSPRYNEHFRNQLTELLTGYGPIAEIWFDGACGEGPNGKRQEYDWDSFRATVKRLQPHAVIFSDAGPGVRWIGNESGIAGDPCWSMVNPQTVPYPGASGDGVIDMLQHGSSDGTVWRPGESDVSIRPGWFWHASEDSKVRTVDNLVDLYFKSVGRNSLLLLNVPPNRQGLFAEPDVERINGFRKALDGIFRNDLAKGKHASASSERGGSTRFGAGKALDGRQDTYWSTDDGVTTGWLEVDLGKPTQFNVSCLQEAIALGQRVSAYHLEYLDGSAWKTLASGTTIGHKKLDRFPTVTAQKVRVSIDAARACPTLSSFGLYYSDRVKPAP
ncbi:MAG TPA: alpha-L-fucosidase [Armatimonadota bacterium]|jgi:alpha-L-fucosidase